MNVQQLNNELGNIDLYLLDQILKGNVNANSKILDAGCGEGRNLIYFLNNGYNVYGFDKNEDAIRMLHFIVGSKYPNYPKDRFIVAELENVPFIASQFNYVICSAVLHFARDENHFWEMFEQLHGMLAPKGTLFIRTASDIGLIGHTKLADGGHLLPDGSRRFLLTSKMIVRLKAHYEYSDVEPGKTVVVDAKRCMTTLVLKKK